MAKIKSSQKFDAIEIEPTDGWFIELKVGWKMAHDPMCPVHCGGASTLTEAMTMLRDALPCDCERCRHG